MAVSSEDNDLVKYILNILLIEALMSIVEADQQGRSWTNQMADELQRIIT